MREKIELVLGKLLVSALISVTLAITPLWSMDPINPIKMLGVSALGFVGLGILLANRRVLLLGRFAVPLVLISSFVLWLFVVFAISGGERLQQLFGTNGRNTGLVTYLGFSILFVVAMTASNAVFLHRFLFASLFVGIASIVYGLIQAAGADPFDWVNPYSPVFGFLGNPNFQSSLLGILGSVVFTQLLSSAVKLQIKGAYIVYLLVTLFVIRETDSQQGYLVLLIGSAVSLGVYINQRNRALGYSYAGLALVGFIAVLVGTLNQGPLASLLYKESITFRGYYWRAGWKMTLDNPIFGVGLDSYGDWYRRTRSIEATIRRGPDVTSNAAHNVFLDISSNGGFPLLLIYLALMVLVVISSVKVIKRSQEFNTGFVGILAAWVAFQAQSIISINQIGLALWGWVLSGLIIGYEASTRGTHIVVEKQKGKSAAKPAEKTGSTTVSMFIGLAVGALVGMPPYLASAQFKGSLESGSPSVIQEAAYLWPTDSSRMIQVAMGLNENNLNEQALQVAVDAAERFPDNYFVWATLNSMNNASETQKQQAMAQMKRLDPLNPNLQ